MTIRTFEFKVKITVDDKTSIFGKDLSAKDVQDRLKDPEWNDNVEVERLGYQVAEK